MKQSNNKHHDDIIDRILRLGLGSLLGLATLSGAILASSKVSATDPTGTSYVDNVKITVPISCSMGGTGSDSHNATMQADSYSAASGSDYEQGIGKTTLTTFCNDHNGFSIYAIGFTNDTTSGDNTKLIGTNTGLKINTAVYTPGDTTSSWSMKVTKVTDSSISYNPTNLAIQDSYDSWHVVPATYSKIAQYHAQTGSSATDTGEGALGSKLETTYAAYVSGTQAADTYVGQVKYIMVHPYDMVAGTYAIAYNANGGTGSMSSSTNVPNYESYTLPTNTFTAPSGYQFAGWCTTQDQTQTPYQTTCSGTSYPDQGAIPPSTIASNTTLNLYAYWKTIANH